jgi:hypothetical protein
MDQKPIADLEDAAHQTINHIRGLLEFVDSNLSNLTVFQMCRLCVELDGFRAKVEQYVAADSLDATSPCFGSVQ